MDPIRIFYLAHHEYDAKNRLEMVSGCVGKHQEFHGHGKKDHGVIKYCITFIDCNSTISL